MIVYNPHNEKLINERLAEAEKLLSQIPAKHCFITGSFLYKEKYNDIDIFVITRAKKEFKLKKNIYHNTNNNKITITIVDFNDLYSLFYHSISKSCISKNILPSKFLKVTLSDYWQVLNEAVPTIMNQKNKFHKHIRSLILYTEYFKTQNVLDTFSLEQKIKEFKNHQQILDYIEKETPLIFRSYSKASYLKRFLYTQAGFYKDILSYHAQKFLYDLTHNILKRVANT